MYSLPRWGGNLSEVRTSKCFGRKGKPPRDEKERPLPGKLPKVIPTITRDTKK